MARACSNSKKGAKSSKKKQHRRWGPEVPRGIDVRRAHRRRCLKQGKQCYLAYDAATDTPSYPVCAVNSCDVACEALPHAMARATQHGRPALARLARQLECTLKC
jgi:hypothetical protein